MKLLKKLSKIIKKKKFLLKLNWFRISGKKIKIIVGGGNTVFKDWIYSDINILDITKINNWEKYFKENEISNILAEHVWEHLTINESIVSLKNCFKYLKNDGKIRIAVPDGFSPDKDYIDMVKPGGSGDGSKDHKILYNYIVLKKQLELSGFYVELIEYFNESGNFVKNDWSIDDGFIYRSFTHDKRNTGKLKYTSLIIDGIKK